MIFYQQGAVRDKGLTIRDLRAARIDTAIGAIVTQLVMAGVLVAAAVALHGRSGSLHTVFASSHGHSQARSAAPTASSSSRSESPEPPCSPASSSHSPPPGPYRSCLRPTAASTSAPGRRRS